MEEYIPENNPVLLFLLIVASGGLYLFWWLARVSKVFGDDPVMNILLSIFTAGLWLLFLLVRYLQKSEIMNGRDMKWYMVLFILISPLIIQNNINEKMFPDR